MKRTIALLICITAFFCLFALSAFAEEEEVVRIIACSDFQHTETDKGNNETCSVTVRNILSTMAKDGVTEVDGFLCCGDYDREYSDSVQGIRDLKEVISSVVTGEVVLAQGNHDDLLPGTGGLAPSGDNDPASGKYGVYVISEDEYMAGIQDRATVTGAASALREYLIDKVEEGFGGPVFVLSHLPLHYTMRSYYYGDCRYAAHLVSAMNDAAARGLNIVYLFGHNHSYYYDNYLGQGSVYLAPGDAINVATEWNAFAPVTLGFHYMNPGYVGYCYPYEEGADSALTMTLFEIRDGELTVKRYDENSLHNLKSEGVDSGVYPNIGFEVDHTVYASPRAVKMQTPRPTVFDVTFMVEGIETAKCSTTKKNGAVTPPSDPIKAPTAKYTYTFEGWVDSAGRAVDFDNITESITVYAEFKSMVNRYTVTFKDETKNEIERITADYGSTVTPPKAPTKPPTEKYTYTFDEWVDENGEPATLSQITADITLYPTYVSTLNRYTVTFMNGDELFCTVTVDYGAEATAATPEREKEGFTKYTFSGWSDAHGNEAELTCITDDLTVYARYSEECEHSFLDITAGSWFEEAVEWALMKGVMNGEGAVFNPNKATTRAMLVTVLYRLEGSPDFLGVTLPFNDVKENEWYFDAVKWAYVKGVVNGVSPTAFAPTAILTREQFATVLFRYAKEIRGEGPSASGDLSGYTDGNEISGYAVEAFAWANEKGYLNGTSATRLSPKGSATRAQMATILYRFEKKAS